MVEGWCIGATPQPTEDLTEPVNQLEADEDADCVWRIRVNDLLGGEYAELSALFDRSWYLRAPGWEQVVEWRWQQALAEHQGFRDRAGIEAFLQPFQRIVLHMQEHNSQFDRIIELTPEHRITP